MELFAFLGGFAAVAAGIAAIYQILRRKLRRFSSRTFGTPDILNALSELELEVEESPRSLNACDSLLMPQILRDFPDFDGTLAKTYVREYLRDRFGKNEDFTVHNIAIARYLPSGAQKTIVYQAAVSWLEQGRRSQKRFDLHYTFLLDQSRTSVAANCPNCGGALGYGEQECPYCGSRVANALGSTWEFTECMES